MEKEDTVASARTTLSRASSMVNCFRGSKIMSAFQLARGYAPSILGLPGRVVSHNLLDAHVEKEATRAFELIIRAEVPSMVSPSMISPGTQILVF